VAIAWALILSVGCAEKSPRMVLDEYKAALEHGDLKTAVDLSDTTFRAAYATGPRPIDAAEMQAAASRLALAAGDARVWCDLDLAGGDRVRLVKEKDGWKIAAGGLEIGRFDTPEASLRSFFFGVEAKAWAVVRGAMPKRHRDAFASDEALASHVDSIRGRIDRARKELGDLFERRASVKGDSAEIAYGDGRRVTFEREDGVWRVLDLE
jgi:hypothetical protein